MKKLMITSMMLATVSVAGVAHAQERDGSYTELKQGTAFTTSAVAGAVLGGPVGMILGALGGAYVGEQIEQADEVKTMKQSLASASAELEQLHLQLARSQQAADDFQQLAVESLDLKVLFHTASDSLSEHGALRVKELAGLLRGHEQMQVRLDGYADPRGTDEYNNVLSHYRAEAVRSALIEAGIAANRIELFSHGANQSTASQGDLKGYAAERKVEIDVVVPSANAAVVMN